MQFIFVAHQSVFGRFATCINSACHRAVIAGTIIPVPCHPFQNRWTLGFYNFRFWEHILQTRQHPPSLLPWVFGAPHSSGAPWQWGSHSAHPVGCHWCPVPATRHSPRWHQRLQRHLQDQSRSTIGYTFLIGYFPEVEYGYEILYFPKHPLQHPTTHSLSLSKLVENVHGASCGEHLSFTISVNVHHYVNFHMAM